MGRRTIKLYLFLESMFSLGDSFIYAIYVIYMVNKGSLNPLQVNLVNTAFFVSLLAFEVPTGAVADVFGRKLSYILSFLLVSLGFYAYGLGDSFGEFIVAEVIAGIGGTFRSGATQAWLIDSLKHYDYDANIGRILAKRNRYCVGIGIIGAISGSYLMRIEPSLPWLVGGSIIFFTGVIALFTMKEEYRVRRRINVSEGFVRMYQTTRISMKYASRSKVFRFVIIAGLLEVLAVQGANMQWQPYFARLAGGEERLGFVFTAISLSLIAGSLLAERLVKQRNEKRLIILGQLVIGLAMIASAGTSLLPLALGSFLIHEVGRGLTRPVRDAYLNDHIPSEQRATLISFQAMSGNVGAIVGLVVTGLIATNYSIRHAWVLSSLILIAGSLYWLLRNGRT